MPAPNNKYIMLDRVVAKRIRSMSAGARSYSTAVATAMIQRRVMEELLGIIESWIDHHEKEGEPLPPLAVGEDLREKLMWLREAEDLEPVEVDESMADAAAA